MRHLKYVLIPLLLLLQGCWWWLKVDEPQEEIVAPEVFLPPITTTGAGTLGAMIDGEVWISGECTFVPFWTPGGDGCKPTATYQATEQRLILSGYRKWIEKSKTNKYEYVERQTDLTIIIDSIDITSTAPFAVKKGEIYLGTVIRSYDGDSLLSDKSIITENFTDSKFQFFRFDTLNGVVSGTFEFTAANDSTTFIVTDGRFDLFLY
jgi:hypothetical protein